MSRQVVPQSTNENMASQSSCLARHGRSPYETTVTFKEKTNWCAHEQLTLLHIAGRHPLLDASNRAEEAVHALGRCIDEQLSSPTHASSKRHALAWESDIASTGTFDRNPPIFLCAPHAAIGVDREDWKEYLDHLQLEWVGLGLRSLDFDTRSCPPQLGATSLSELLLA